MKKLHSFKALAMLSVLAAGSVQGYSDCEGPLERGRWYLLPKIGVAPGIFANRGYEQYVVPAAAIPANCVTTDTNELCRALLTDYQDVLQQNGCRSPKFGQLWSNGVFHFGFEVGHNTADNGQCFLEFFYDRANGKSVCHDLRSFRARPGCQSDDCNTDCSTFSGEALETAKRTDCLDKYVAYGAYIGHRHYFNRIWCDRFAFFTGVKFGLQHRKSVNVNSTTAPFSEDITIPGEREETYTYTPTPVCQTFYCKSNAVSGSIQFGVDYCINDCFTALLGVEVQATAPFKTNQNVVINIVDGTVNGETVANSALYVAQATNFIPASTGTFVQFPVWVGVRWEFDFCKSSC